ncbi:aldolase/citrate lyase family protein [Cysteiniphilum halobium]|uniref:aldolase/citrate lyase family protein n=1 Tax=Cysteiniphilum halobium TaxID=2219059 RepID=UPI003F85C3E5
MSITNALQSLIFISAIEYIDDIEKILNHHNVDAVILDLESLVEDKDKQKARENLLILLRNRDLVKRVSILLRPNPIQINEGIKDITFLRKNIEILQNVTGFVFAHVNDKVNVDQYCYSLKLENFKFNMVILETLKGFENISEISSNGSIHAFMFGKHDLTLELKYNSEKNLNLYRTTMQEVALKYGKIAFDAPKSNKVSLRIPYVSG